MDRDRLAAGILDTLPANRTLGLVVTRARDGTGVAELPVGERVHNVIASLHSSGLVALADAAGLAAVLSAAPDEATALRVQPLGVGVDGVFRTPVRGLARAECMLDPAATRALEDLFSGRVTTARIRTRTRIGSADRLEAAEVTFTWSVRLGP